MDEDLEISWSSDTALLLPCPISYGGLNGNEMNITEEKCDQLSCDFNSDEQVQCSLPANKDLGYTVAGPRKVTDTGFKIPLKRVGNIIYENPIDFVTFEVFMLNNQILRFKVSQSSCDIYLMNIFWGSVYIFMLLEKNSRYIFMYLFYLSCSYTTRTKVDMKFQLH